MATYRANGFLAPVRDESERSPNESEIPDSYTKKIVLLSKLFAVVPSRCVLLVLLSSRPVSKVMGSSPTKLAQNFVCRLDGSKQHPGT